MEFASEMAVKATIHQLKISEVPTTLAVDGRDRAPYLNTWSDGWRHLRFLLIYSPRWLFLYPGLLAMLFGILIMLLLIPGPRMIGELELDVHTMLFAAMTIILGQSAVSFSLFSKIFAIGAKLVPRDERVEQMLRILNLERGLLCGFILVILGVIGALYAVMIWGTAEFGPLNQAEVLRVVIPSLTGMAVGFQLMLSSFFISVLMLGHK